MSILHLPVFDVLAFQPAIVFGGIRAVRVEVAVTAEAVAVMEGLQAVEVAPDTEYVTQIIAVESLSDFVAAVYA